MQTEYFYKTGHCQALSLAEFESITQSQPRYNDDFIFSDKRLRTERTGAVVFGGVVLYKITDFNARNRAELQEVLYDVISLGRANDKFKKIGISCPARLSTNLIELAKQAGSKKVNVIKDQYPNFGHWKQTNDWLILFYHGKDLIVGEIMDYADQQFWSKLDTRLPAGDMKRGLINLKLARSLLNLTKKKIIWDPFCGQGRLLVAGLDLKNVFYATDIDKSCLPDVKKNIEYARFQFSKRFRKLAHVKDIFELDGQELEDTYIVEGLQRAGQISDLAIVTEGTLGYNFTKTPTDKEIQNQFNHIYAVWAAVLKQANKAGISEVVFCLPFYKFKRKQVIPPFIHELVNGTSYTLQLFSTQPYMLYSREKTRVGHCIVKISQ